MNEQYKQLGVSDAVLTYGETILASLRERFDAIDAIAEANQLKVINAMQKNRVAANHFNLSTGYGYDDEGRDTLERVYADCFGAEAALVRPQITCGTHALALALGANLLPGDELLSPVGAPYDTLEEVIGIRESVGSLKEYGVSYRQVDLLPDGSFDLDGIRAAINEKTKLVTIQRSKGYATRPSFSVEQIGRLIAFCKRCKPDVICMVDNCYGEFTELTEPVNVGADMMVGSLIKNPGGGLAPTGGYICGRADLIERCARRLTAPGLGREVGANLGLLTSFYQGFFLAPTVVASAVKGAVFAAACYERLGFRVVPPRRRNAARHHSGGGAGQPRGDDRLLQGHPVRRTGGQLCDPGAVPHAGLRQRRDHGRRRLCAGQLHRAVCRRSHPSPLRRVLSGRPDVVPRQAGHPDEPAENAGGRPDFLVIM